MTNTSIQVALPARMSLAENAFDKWEIAVLEFPFTQRVYEFCKKIEDVLRDKKNNRITPPYRQLNNALLTVAPTLTHGFEYIKKQDDIAQYRALAVGTPENPLQTPEPEKIHQLIINWANIWIKQYRTKGKKDEIDSVCDRFLDDISNIPEQWKWQHIKPETLIKNLNSEEGLGFQAIPSLLATQLHGRSCTIKSGDREQEIRWRKVIGNTNNRTGLYLVSQPFQGFYVDDNGKEKTGYFAYRLDFNVETQAGRFNTEGNLKPWIFLHLSCQRYAHEPLKEPNYNQDISILVGMNKSRLSGYELDSTLVRLVVDNSSSNDNFYWKYRLPELLADFKARNLEDVSEIFNNPAKYGNLNNTSNWGDKDEYYIVHDEGYRYLNEETQRNRGHSIKTGFSFAERGDITAKVLELLDGVLIPDTPLETDIPTPKGQKKPLAMSSYKDIFKSTKKLEVRQKTISDGIQRALKHKPMHIFIICKEKDTHELTYQQLREAFLLADGEDFPSFIKVSQIWIDDYTLLQPLNTEGLKPRDKDFKKQIKKQHQKKRDAWSNFLQTKALNLINDDVDSDCFAIIEIGKTKQKGILPQQNIKGAIREACIRNNIHSQMVQTVKRRVNKQEDEEDYTKAEKARILNSVLDLILRQTATLYGKPLEIYKQAKIPESIAKELDVIAICRRKIIQYQGDIHYALAVRLRANGDVDVLFPHASDWIPYTEAEIELGRMFSHARRDRFQGKYRVESKIKLSNPELMQFVSRVLTQKLDKPTIALIEAEGWRNERASNDKDKMWFQLKNEHLFEKRNILDFAHVAGHSCQYSRANEQLNNLLAVIRSRNGKETPQYITNREKWDKQSLAEDFINLCGFWDKSVPELPHYFSVGKLPDTQKKQREKNLKELYMLDSHKEQYGFNMAVKHQKMLELVPFFVHPDFQNEQHLKVLCRVPHYLRNSPSWSMGNISSSYPMHLGNSLIDDCLCILGLDS